MDVSPVLGALTGQRPIHPLNKAQVAVGRTWRLFTNARRLKNKIVRDARTLDADLVGVVLGRVRRSPEAIWSRGKTVIVLGVPMLLPIIESTPSISYTVTHDTSNVLLDEAANELAILVNGLGARVAVHAARRPGRPAGEDRDASAPSTPAWDDWLQSLAQSEIQQPALALRFDIYRRRDRGRSANNRSGAVQGMRALKEARATQSVDTVDGSLLATFDAIGCTLHH
jgi:hypothetical protein